MCDGIWHRVIKDKYLPHTIVLNWFRSPTFHQKATSRIWYGLLKSVHLITHWLSWTPGSGQLIALGRDMILGMGDKSFLSSNLLSELRQRNITSLSQARRHIDPLSSSSFWINSTELGFTGDMATEWDRFQRELIDSGAFLQDIEDELMWIGGDNSGSLTVKNTYLAILSTQGLARIGGWRQVVWKWDIQLKIKLFIWLAPENKILTWNNLQQRGWEGPSRCHLCKQDSENITHLFIHLSFTKSVWERLVFGQKYKKCWEGNTLSDCFKNWVEDKSVPSMIVAHICWYIWLERNTTIFEETTPSIHSVIYKALGSQKRHLATQKLFHREIF
jgi:hypothetical protein